VLRAGLEHGVAGMSIVSIDTKLERQGKAALKEGRANQLVLQDEQLQWQRQVANKLIKKRPLVRTQERRLNEATGLEDIDKPRVVRNDDPEHRRIYAVVCYTNLFDKILADMLKYPCASPFELLMQMNKMPYWSTPWEAGLAFFDLTVGYEIDAGAAMIDAGCEEATLRYELGKFERDKQLWLLGMQAEYLAIRDGVKSPDGDPSAMIKFLDGSLRRMMQDFKANFSPWLQWTSDARVDQPSFVAKMDSDGTPLCRTTNILLSGNPGLDVDTSRLSRRMVSTTYDLGTAIAFTKTEMNGPPMGTLLVLVLDLHVEVVNVHAVTSTLSDSFLCFEEECEVIVEPGCQYMRMNDLSAHPVHQEEWQKTETQIKPAKRPAKVEFYRVLAPRRLRVQ
jgi:hypothetical protein